MKFSNTTTFYDYIRILLIKTNLMIYICYMKCGGNADICVLAVGDDELSHGDNEKRGHSSEAAEGWGTREESRGWMLVCSSHARTQP